MHQRFNAIVLGTVRHSDRVSIIHLYTDTHGRMAAVIPAGGSSRASRMRRAATMPLSVIEGEINFRTDRELQTLGRYTLARPNNGIYGNPAKSAVALFIAEFLSNTLREALPDPLLWQFLDTSVRELDTTPAAANFHLAFLSRMTAFAGITPDTGDYTPHARFDMREGRYTDHTPPHADVLAGEEARMPLLLSKLDYVNCRRLRMSADTRRRLLAGLIRYYAIHIPGADRFNSTEILRQVFA